MRTTKTSTPLPLQAVVGEKVRSMRKKGVWEGGGRAALLLVNWAISSLFFLYWEIFLSLGKSLWLSSSWSSAFTFALSENKSEDIRDAYVSRICTPALFLWNAGFRRHSKRGCEFAQHTKLISTENFRRVTTFASSSKVLFSSNWRCLVALPTKCFTVCHGNDATNTVRWHWRISIVLRF